MNTEFYTIEDNQVVLHATKWFDKRIVTSIDEKNKEATLGFLQDKFADITQETMLLKADYINAVADDKVKLAGKINRHRTYLSTVKAIGDYAVLFTTLDEMEGEIKKVVDANIAKRQELLATAKSLATTESDWKNSTEKIGEIAKELKAMPLVPDPRIEEIKQQFDALRDEFFSKKKGHYEGQEQIMLDNLAHKIELCEKAEVLAVSTEWKKTTEEINTLNEDWKKIGHIPRHRSDELWMRFNAAKDLFFNKKREHFETMKVGQEGALVIKLELIEKAVALKDSRDWKKTSDAYEQLLKEWKASGRVNSEQNDEVWAKFNEPRNFFYDAKNTYYNSVKLNLEDNFSKKAIIVTRAEEIAEDVNVEWESATAEMMEMTEDWKKIGRVAKEHGDELWERFLKAKRTFFDRKDAERERRRSEGGNALGEKVNRNKSYSGKLERELDLEREIMADFQNRLKNIVPGVRSFETQERYESIIAEAQKKVAFLETKIKDVKSKTQNDEKEMNYLLKPFHKKGEKKEGEANTDRAPREKREFTDRPKRDFTPKPDNGSGMPNLSSLVNAALGNKVKDLVKETPAEKVVEPIQEPFAEVAKEVEPIIEPTIEAIVEAATEPTAEPTEPIAETVTETVAEVEQQPILELVKEQPIAENTSIAEVAVQAPITEQKATIAKAIQIETPTDADDITIQSADKPA
jgi:hypothetical protein